MVWQAFFQVNQRTDEEPLEDFSDHFRPMKKEYEQLRAFTVARTWFRAKD